MIKLFQIIRRFVKHSMIILNDRCGNDLNGSFTYISAECCSLKDYVLCSLDLLPHWILLLKPEQSLSTYQFVLASKTVYFKIQSSQKIDKHMKQSARTLSNMIFFPEKNHEIF